MTDTDRPRFAQAMFTLAEMFGDTMSELRIAAYWMSLDDLSIEQIEHAIAKCGKGAKYFPRPVELREAILGNPEHLADVAWLAWKHASTRIGGGASVVITDAALAETLVAVFGGWAQVCRVELSPEMWASKRKEFDRVYRVMLSRDLVGTRYLVGEHEQHNNERTDWQRFTPVGLIDGAIVKQLSGEQAQCFRENAIVKAIES